ncbi:MULTISPECIES: tetratricopeptide repeat protein [unclassified Brenneria]|uniref:tetratricopeptide repeat protein n=1 Tax=unclassified Brenneria TaxID=2634434 RepID=UPI0018F05DF9|nr:tetratricopeptide repeat protein [Brenneria sp. L3-3C-1]MBJ7222718.1 tetratricopeptide repeat protein [Brenneria sp. L3-3C-1]MEE3643961.1 tetratricopeptide repeat protein [Brenneria sp. L3_3C_1]
MDYKYRIGVVLCVLISLAGCVVPPHADKTAQRHATMGESDLRIAASALHSGDLNVALPIYSRLIERQPDNASAWLGMADIHFLSGELGAASKAYATAQRLEPENIDAQLGQARVLVRQRNLTAAIARFQSILSHFPNHPLALSGLGVSYDLADDPDRAQSTYRRGLSLHPDDSALRTNLGLSLALNGKPREAINVLLGDSGVSGKLPQERDNLALAYGMLGRDDAAEEILMSNQSRSAVEDNLAFYHYLRQNMR